ncbi:MAG: hypothetical protein Q4B09_07750 [Lachnospiraceae bacterium]|nr:hypothetical protein [Lachnospiraceae bacterium]
MNNYDFENRLRKALHTCEETPSQQTILLANMELKKRRNHISFFHFLIQQVHYVGWKLWGSQSLMLLLICFFLRQLYGGRLWEYPRGLGRLLLCMSVLVTMMSLPLLARSVQHRMQEVEAATYFSSVRLLLAKLIVIGIGDSLMLMGIFAMAMTWNTLQASAISLYLILPFLAVSAVNLFLLGHMKGQKLVGLSLVMDLILILLATSVPGHYLPRQNFGWLLICGILVLVCIQQLHHLVATNSYAELQIS